MTEKLKDISRRNFIKTSGVAAASGFLAPSRVLAQKTEPKILQVWSCGGLAEAFLPASREFKQKTGVSISYTGAFAAALGKSLLGSSKTEVFAPRVLKLSQKLKETGKMLWHKPLCFTRYVIAVPRGNPAGITSIKDMARPGIRVVLSFRASAPGGKATTILMKKAGALEGAQQNAILNGDCVQRTTKMLLNGKADAAVVEQRILHLPEFIGRLDTIPIDEKYFPPPPMSFTIGVMKWASDLDLAKSFVDFIISSEGQSHFEKAGFIPAISDEGKRLTRKYGV
jgi:molybdate transport system substrate-binding protein